MLEYPVKDGNWHLARFIVQTRGENGEAEQVLFAMRLYSEEKRREKDLMSAADAARRANEAKSELLSRMSHDIRTPMNVIMGFTNIALQHADDPGKMKECLEKIQITPGGIVDLQTDPAAIDRQAKYGLLEAGFGYHDRIEGALERVMSDMYQIMGVPKATVEDYKGVAASGKAMRALYWPLITRCEEKWAAWDAALTWLVRMLVAIDGAYGANRFGAAQYSVKIEHLWPITEDEEEERERDLKEVRDQVRSRKSYMEKWQPQADSEEELRQIKAEQALLEDAYAGAIGDELNGRIPESPGWRAPDSAGGDRRGEQGDSRGL